MEDGASLIKLNQKEKLVLGISFTLRRYFCDDADEGTVAAIKLILIERYLVLTGM